jgi:hypothetical protein
MAGVHKYRASGSPGDNILYHGAWYLWINVRSLFQVNFLAPRISRWPLDSFHHYYYYLWTHALWGRKMKVREIKDYVVGSKLNPRYKQRWGWGNRQQVSLRTTIVEP